MGVRSILAKLVIRKNVHTFHLFYLVSYNQSGNLLRELCMPRVVEEIEHP